MKNMNFGVICFCKINYPYIFSYHIDRYFSCFKHKFVMDKKATSQTSVIFEMAYI